MEDLNKLQEGAASALKEELGPVGRSTEQGPYDGAAVINSPNVEEITMRGEIDKRIEAITNFIERLETEQEFLRQMAGSLPEQMLDSTNIDFHIRVRGY